MFKRSYIVPKAFSENRYNLNAFSSEIPMEKKKDKILLLRMLWSGETE